MEGEYQRPIHVTISHVAFFCTPFLVSLSCTPSSVTLSRTPFSVTLSCPPIEDVATREFAIASTAAIAAALRQAP